VIYPEKKKVFQHNTTASPQASTSAPSQHQRPAFASITTAQCHLTGVPVASTVLDSGALHHMFNDLAYFVTTKVGSIPISTGSNSTNLTAIRIRTALIAQSDGRILKLHDSLFIPGLSQNLISLTKLVKSTATLKRENQLTCIVIDDNVSFTYTHHNGVLEIKGEIGPVPSNVSALLTSTHSLPTSSFQTWHHCLGHAGIA
jgi:hypothetical protein